MNLSINLNEIAMTESSKKMTIGHGLEYFVLCLVAAVGVIGSVYLYSSNIGNNGGPLNQFSSSAATVIADEDDKATEGSFSDFVNVSGKKKVGEELQFVCKMDIKSKRYVMEMGDGMRMIITQPEYSYQYKVKGKYLLELKTIERGLITTVATKSINVK